MLRVVRHVGLSSNLIRWLSEPEVVGVAARHGLEFRSWAGRRDFDLLLTGQQSPLTEVSRRVARWVLRAETELSPSGAAGYVQAKGFREWCVTVSQALAERSSLPDLRAGIDLVERLTETELHADPPLRRLVHVRTGTTVWISANRWYASAADPLALSLLASEGWRAERIRDAPRECLELPWFSFESLVLSLLIRHRMRLPALPDDLPVEGLFVPDVIGPLGQSRAVGFYSGPSAHATVRQWRERRADRGGELVPALVAAGAVVGAVRSPIRSERFRSDAEARNHGRSKSATVPRAIRALSRFLRLEPFQREPVEPASRPHTERPRGQDKFVICGDFASGKTTALQTLAGATAMTMEVATTATGERAVKGSTTVGFDHGVLQLEGLPIFLYATPGQLRFRPVAETLLNGCHGVILLVNGEDRRAVESTRSWLATIELTTPSAPVVIALNRIRPGTPPLSSFRAVAAQHHLQQVAVVSADPRRPADMLACLRLLVSMLTLPGDPDGSVSTGVVT